MRNRLILLLCLLPMLLFGGCRSVFPADTGSGETAFTLDSVPEYQGTAYYVVNNNVPFFDGSEDTAGSYETYSELDRLGRCGVCVACIGRDLMPTEERGPIGQIRPSGWHTVRYDFIEKKYLYNRCHLIGYQLTGENDNEKNLITGTRYLNVEGMLPFENEVAWYVRRTGNHVLYRVTPIYDGKDLVASGVTMEAASVEDRGAGVYFNVFCYNVQPGVVIDYATGDSRAAPGPSPVRSTSSTYSESEPETIETTSLPVISEEPDYILNTRSKRFHSPSCASVPDISEKNRQDYQGPGDRLLEDGYKPCGECKP